jgi:tetratricopeptide (TPR) repeat protein
MTTPRPRPGRPLVLLGGLVATPPAAAAAALALLALVVATTAAAQSTPRPTRDQALADLAQGGLEARRRAAAWLGELGAMTDAPVLLRALSDPDEVVRRLAERSVWQVWSRSGDPDVDALFQQGVAQMSQGDAERAIETFTTIIDRKPDFAEGWNKRATIYFLVGEYEKSLRDCDQVVKLNPDHFGVLAGYGQIYLHLDQPERALDYFRRALRINPNLDQVQTTVRQLERIIQDKRRGTI